MFKPKKDLKNCRKTIISCKTAIKPKPKPEANGNIRVIVRVRPPNTKEKTKNCKIVVKFIDEQTLVFDPKEDEEPFFFQGVKQQHRDINKRVNKHLQFTFDHVFKFEADNNIVFRKSTANLISILLQGCNGSVFVYGATGAGKTHTMLGKQHDPGVTFLTVKELFHQKEAAECDFTFDINVTYVEVYNENVQDLLNPGVPLQLREDHKYGVVVSGITVHKIETCEMLFDLLEKGNQKRTQHPTDANEESSRSHAIFQVYLTMKCKKSGQIRNSKLSMIDLAGSEKGAATGFSGARFTEGANINRSLLALGNCINSLANGLQHIPYRDSKLTRLLKDSLGGNCHTVMIANISPSSLSYDDTYNTLKYALRAKSIKTNIKKNINNNQANLAYYVKRVANLEQENEELKLKLSLCRCESKKSKQTVSSTQVSQAPPDLTNAKTELTQLYQQKRALEIRLQQLKSTVELTLIRKNLKEQLNTRISDICTETPEKRHGHKRLGNAIDRLQRHTSNLQVDIAGLNEKNEEIDAKIKEFLEGTPEIKFHAEIEDANIECLKANNQVEHFQKVNNLQYSELKLRSKIIDQLSEFLKPCYLQLKGHGLATAELITNYHQLMRHFQGIYCVSFDDEVHDNLDNEARYEYKHFKPESADEPIPAKEDYTIPQSL